MMVPLVEQFRAPAHLAVERMLHRRDRTAYHLRFPKGQCPLCSMLDNALAASRFHERIKALIEDLG